LFIKSAFILITLAALSGCGQTKTQNYYLSHPEELAADLIECHKAGKNTYNCNEADKANFILKKKAENTH